MDRRFRGTWIVLAVALAASAVGYRAELRTRILPDLFNHLSRAEKGLEEGRWQAAVANTDSILLPLVRVHVAFEGVGQNRQSDCLKAVEAAFAAWRQGTGPETSFKIVDSADDADVRITFVPHAYLNGVLVGGTTDWRRSIKTYSNGDCTPALSATMELAAEQPNGRPMTANQMLQIAAHELGHVLGMQDSAGQGDVMGPLNLGVPVTAPRPAELEALAEIREEARRLRLRAQSQTE